MLHALSRRDSNSNSNHCSRMAPREQASLKLISMGESARKWKVMEKLAWEIKPYYILVDLIPIFPIVKILISLQIPHRNKDNINKSLGVLATLES